MLKYISGVYLKGRLSEAGLDQAVNYGWITADEAADLRKQKNPPAPEPEPTPEVEPKAETPAK